MTAWILKTRAVTGKLVPLYGEHRLYEDFHEALDAAQRHTRWYGEGVSVVAFASDDVVETTDHLLAWSKTT